MNYFSESAELADGKPNTFRSTHCDPWDHITYIRERISKQQLDFFKSQQKIEPLFEQGSYRDLTRGISFSNEVQTVFFLEGLTEVVGLPLRWENLNFLSSEAEQLVTSDAQSGSIPFQLAIRAANSDSSPGIKRVFSRMTLANSTAEVVDDLVNRVISAIEYWRGKAGSSVQEKKRYAIEKILIYVEVLARLSTRLSVDRAKTIFRLAMEIGQDKALHDLWLFEVLDHLISYSLNSIPSAQRSELLLEALGFPLATEIVGLPMADRWPNPVIDSAFERGNGTAFDRAVSRLIDAARVGLSSSSASLLRLLPLIRHGVLKQDELDKLGAMVWGANPDYQSVPAIALYSHALLTLPVPDRQKANVTIAGHLFNAEAGLLFTDAHLTALIGASRFKVTPLLPDENQALVLFDRLTEWRPNPVVADPFGFSSQREDLIAQVGQVLGYCVLPILPRHEITEQRFDLLMTFYKDADALSLVVGLPYFAGLNDRIREHIASLIRKGMRGQSSKEVSWSTHALYEWKRLASVDAVPNPPESLFRQLGNLIESKRRVGLASLLWTACELIKKHWLPLAEVNILVECLPELFQEMDYKNIDPTSEEAVTASMIREQCVRLTLELLRESPRQNLIDLIESAKVDPLPEVRFAAHAK
jgi:hypothetical protein